MTSLWSPRLYGKVLERLPRDGISSIYGNMVVQHVSPLKDIKESNPIYIAEYVVGNIISEEATFSWWVPYTLKKRDHIISKVKAIFLKNPHKFGVEVPTLVK